MEKRHQTGISTFSAQITSTISVALVLLLLGIVAFMGIAAHSVTNDIRENIGFDVLLKEDTPETEINRFKQEWINSPYVSSLKYFSEDDALRQWEEETGEDLIELCGVNPFSAEFEIRVKSDYATTDSISKIIAPLKSRNYVSDIVVHTEIVESINQNISSVAFVLILIAAALILISFVLINNTVRLTVYSRRFIIHTMKLVGATSGFIRKPFIVNNIIHGIIASLIAIAILSATLYYVQTLDTSVAKAIEWSAAAVVFGGLTLTGICICAIAALMATNKYLRIDYDDMFK